MSQYSRDRYTRNRDDASRYSRSEYTRGSHSASADAEPQAGRYSRSRQGSRHYSARHNQISNAHLAGRVRAVVLALLALLLTGAAAYGVWYYNDISSRLAGDYDLSLTDVAEDEPYYVLLLGSDSRSSSTEVGRTDTIMVARVDEQEQTCSLISIPRDLRVYLGAEYGYNKINAAYVYGGYDLLIDVVNDLLGIQISYYVFLYFDGFEDLVDELGGVTVAVPEGTYYNGTWVQAGDAVEINGTEALVLARCRHGYPADTGAYARGDYQRTINQRNLIKAIAKKVLDQKASKYPKLVSAIADCIDTNMSVNKIISLAKNMKGMDVDSIESCQMPVAGATIGGIWYAVAFEDVFQEVKSNFKNGREWDDGIAEFNDEFIDGTVTGSPYYVEPLDGAVYSYVYYENIYGNFYTIEEEEAEDTES